MKINSVCALLMCLLISSCSEQPPAASDTASADPKLQLLRLGQSRAVSCASCHGQQGVSAIAAYPSLAGRSQAELKAALLAYRGGEKTNALMSAQASALSDADIELLSAYFAALPAAKN